MTIWNFEGAIVPISGAASGIGLAIAKQLRQAGATPLLLDFNAQNLQKAAQETYGSNNSDAQRYAYHLDVADSAAVDACFVRIQQEHGTITHAVANAGRAIATSILESSDEQWHALMDVNLHGVMYFARAAARQLVQQERGAMVLMASIAGLGAKENRVAYASSKAAVVNMTRALALDLGPTGIRVNAIAPGVIATPIQMTQAFEKPVQERAALKRVGQPDEIANVTLFLLSELASYITGTTVVADGGLTARYN